MLRTANPFDSKTILEGIRRWVEIETPTEAPGQINKLATMVAEGYRDLPASIERVAGSDGCGDHIMVRSSWGQDQPGILVLSHLDTVHPLGFIERLPFSYLHVFSFSKRPGTRAAEHANQVPAPVVKNRARELRALGEEKMKEFRRSQVGRELRVLTLRDAREFVETTPALSSNYLRVGVRGKFAANEWLDVTVADGDERLVGEPTLATLPSC